MITVWWSAACLIHYRFLNARETIASEKYAQQIDEMHHKLQGLQPASINRMNPILHDSAQLLVAQPALQKLDELGYELLPPPPYSPGLLPTDCHFFKHLETFCRENVSTTRRKQKKKKAKMLSKSSSNPEAWIFIF